MILRVLKRSMSHLSPGSRFLHTPFLRHFEDDIVFIPAQYLGVPWHGSPCQIDDLEPWGTIAPLNFDKPEHNAPHLRDK